MKFDIHRLRSLAGVIGLVYFEFIIVGIQFRHNQYGGDLTLVVLNICIGVDW